MRTVDVRQIHAPSDDVFRAARDVERWPALLPHYRRVRVLERHADRTVVEMAAWRPFGALRWPTWWVSEMWVDEARRLVRYRHVRGVTTGMDVVWSVTAGPDGTTATIVHEWDGPPWPVIGRAAAEWIIGPVFVHGIASRTLAGLARHLEQHHD
ncbi:MAG TPA: SRPBCC family protein [Gemmatimonadales bacterium]|nr:SRPBCC family protein [Gemmatimonadales bacterium]